MLRQHQQQGIDPTSYYTTWSHIDSQSTADFTETHVGLNGNGYHDNEKFKTNEEFLEKLGGSSVDRLFDGLGTSVSPNAGFILLDELTKLIDDDPHSQLNIDNGFCDGVNFESRSKNAHSADIFSFDG